MIIKIFKNTLRKILAMTLTVFMVLGLSPVYVCAEPAPGASGVVDITDSAGLTNLQNYLNAPETAVVNMRLSLSNPGTYAPLGNLTVPDGVTLNWLGNLGLLIDNGHTLTVNDTITIGNYASFWARPDGNIQNYGLISVNGHIINEGTLVNSGILENRGTITNNGIVVFTGYSHFIGSAISGTVNSTAPSAPQNFTAVPGNAQVALTWDEAANGGSPIIRYEVRVGSGSWQPASSDTSHTFTELTNGTEYTFSVRAENAEGPGAEAAITATPNYLIFGDINGDRRVNIVDISTLRLYIAGHSVTIKHADLNGDGYINRYDVDLLRFYLTGHDVKNPTGYWART